MYKELLAVFLGGGVGSILRYCAQLALHERIQPYSFPWATLTVNIVGSFLIGLFLHPVGTLQPDTRSAAAAHHRTVWRVHHVLHLQ